MFAVIQVRIGRGQQDHSRDQDQEHHRIAQQTRNRQSQQRRAAYHPQPSAKTMGGVPVFLVVEGPGQLDAHGVALAALGQVIADDDEGHAHHGTGDAGNVHLIAKGIEADGST